VAGEPQPFAAHRAVVDQLMALHGALFNTDPPVPPQAPQQRSNATVLQLQRIKGLGTETADMLTHEVLARDLRDQRAVARYAGLTGSPDESGRRQREKRLAKTGNARVRRGMIQLAWRFLVHQKHSGIRQASPPARRSARPWSWRLPASCSSRCGGSSRPATYRTV
jgi:hypothetical protein